MNKIGNQVHMIQEIIIPILVRDLQDALKKEIALEILFRFSFYVKFEIPDIDKLLIGNIDLKLFLFTLKNLYGF
jgi:hypothetical protein